MEELEKQTIQETDRGEILNESPQKKKRKKISTYVIAAIVVSLVFSGKVIMSSQGTADWLSDRGFFGKLKHLVPGNDKFLAGEEEDRINILLLGMGGEGHDGAYLADTIIIASLKPSTKQVSMVSIPRDLTVPMGDGSWRKANHINALAEAKEAGSGGPETMSALGNILELPIHYYIRVDFQGFMNIIDEIGGIDVDVENTLDDYAYPIMGQEDNPNYYARFEHLHIDKGLQKMNGALALKYARSRHAYGIEGSDFARARRQQLVITAVKDKLLSRQTLLNPMTISKLIGELDRSVATDLEVWELLKLWNSFKDIQKDQIISKVLSDAPDGLLVSSVGDGGAYILVPASGNFSKIKQLFQDIFLTEQPALLESVNDSKKTNTENSVKTLEKISSPADISIKNGTWITGLASRFSEKLSPLGFTVVETGNAPERNYEETLVFDLTYGNNNGALETIKKISGAKQSFEFPAWIKEYQAAPEAADFVLILGTNADKAE